MTEWPRREEAEQKTNGRASLNKTRFAVSGRFQTPFSSSKTSVLAVWDQAKIFTFFHFKAKLFSGTMAESYPSLIKDIWSKAWLKNMAKSLGFYLSLPKAQHINLY